VAGTVHFQDDDDTVESNTSIALEARKNSIVASPQLCLLATDDDVTIPSYYIGSPVDMTKILVELARGFY